MLLSNVTSSHLSRFFQLSPRAWELEYNLYNTVIQPEVVPKIDRLANFYSLYKNFSFFLINIFNIFIILTFNLYFLINLLYYYIYYK